MTNNMSNHNWKSDRWMELYALCNQAFVSQQFFDDCMNCMKQEWMESEGEEVLTVQQLLHEWEEHHARS